MTCRDPHIVALRARAAGLRDQAATVRDLAQYADGPAYGQDMDNARRLEADAAGLDALAARAEATYIRDVRAISTGVSRLGIPDDALREMIRRHTGGRTASRAETTAQERRAILDELRGKGFTPRPQRAAPQGGGAKAPVTRGTSTNSSKPAMLAKIDALCASPPPGLEPVPRRYAEAILRRQRGIADGKIACPLEQATPEELRGVIAALHRRAKRNQKRE